MGSRGGWLAIQVLIVLQRACSFFFSLNIFYFSQKHPNLRWNILNFIILSLPLIHHINPLAVLRHECTPLFPWLWFLSGAVNCNSSQINLLNLTFLFFFSSTVSIAHIKHTSINSSITGVRMWPDYCAGRKKISPHLPLLINTVWIKKLLGISASLCAAICSCFAAPHKNGKGINFPPRINRYHYKVAKLPTRSLLSRWW